MDAACVGLWDWNARTSEFPTAHCGCPCWVTPKAKLASTFATFCNLLHPEDRERTLTNNERMLNDPEVKYEAGISTARTKVGEYRWIPPLVMSSPAMRRGRALRALGTHTDITRRKQAELDVHRLNQNLIGGEPAFRHGDSGDRAGSLGSA